MDTSTGLESAWPSARLAPSGPVAAQASGIDRPSEREPDSTAESTAETHSERERATELWAAALSALSGKISAHNFELWLRPIRCLRIDGRTIQLQAPNSFLQDWFGSNYLRIILDEVRRVAAADHDFVVQWLPPEGAGSDGTASQRGQVTAQAQRSVARGRKRGSDAHDPGTEAPATAEVPASTSRGRATPPRPAASEAGRSPAPASNVAQPSGLHEKYTFASFIVGPSNQLAEAASRAVAENPAGKYNPLFIYGGVGLGKTHLLHAIGSQIRSHHPTWRIVYLKAETFLNEYVQQVRNGRIDEFRARYRDHVDVLLVDDIQYFGGKERTQDEFFHTFNALFESHRQIVVTADKYPHEIPDLEERIRSRFQWGLIADIQPPELETRIAILEKKAQLEGVDLPSEVAHFLASHIKSNVRELEGLLIRVAAMASLRQQPITVDFAQETLKSFLGQISPHLSIAAVQKEVANYFGISLADLCGASRQAKLARARQIAMYLSRKLCKASYPELGERFGGKDHTTVMSACRRIDALLSADPKVRASVEEIEKHLTV
ncbi:MAG: chromosomal replication initiator protein DnaA [Myxococcales bacterium]|nr:chromosomal replication initiator protein DnaA [Myxococcales bacterium]